MWDNKLFTTYLFVRRHMWTYSPQASFLKDLVYLVVMQSLGAQFNTSTSLKVMRVHFFKRRCTSHNPLAVISSESVCCKHLKFSMLRACASACPAFQTCVLKHSKPLHTEEGMLEAVTGLKSREGHSLPRLPAFPAETCSSAFASEHLCWPKFAISPIKLLLMAHSFKVQLSTANTW